MDFTILVTLAYGIILVVSIFSVIMFGSEAKSAFNLGYTSISVVYSVVSIIAWIVFMVSFSAFFNTLPVAIKLIF